MRTTMQRSALVFLVATALPSGLPDIATWTKTITKTKSGKVDVKNGSFTIYRGDGKLYLTIPRWDTDSVYVNSLPFGVGSDDIGLDRGKLGSTRVVRFHRAGKLAPHLTPGNLERCIADCTGMTKREVEEYLVHLAPKPVVSPGSARRPAPVSGRATAAMKPGSVEPCQPDLYNLRFAADRAFMDKLARAAKVSGVGNASRDMAQIFARALDAYLQKHDPRQRQERREKKATRKALAEAEAVIRKVTAGPVARDDDRHGDDDRQGGARSRTIPTSVRDRLLIGAGHRCEYTSSEGLRCSERSHLAIDHIVPWGLGGTSAAGNLRVLCVAHNRLHADRCFGAEFMDHKIESARSTSARKDLRPSGYQRPVADKIADRGGVREGPTVGRGARRTCRARAGRRGGRNDGGVGVREPEFSTGTYCPAD